MGFSDELERLVTLNRHQIERVCTDATQIPEFIGLCRDKFDEHLLSYEALVDDDETQAQFHWQEAVAWRETSAVLTLMCDGALSQRRSA
ncbi:hypothetical protein [Gordonia crocea]|uniref:TY-Chap C-terminal domain-containing protein n=1 Tax=Gordonia crocea TaxID=589162 RepID=A0A7I9V0J5_9ACTN|nr:hypothetical protein [Gordonia crocea]GED98706.1 hypothetical protein nbrc107697_27450 [Gordonia crocea]